jgi:capsule polysaccharide export protein KpsE/RkpR
LQQIYGDGNVRVRAARARIGVLKSELTKMSGSASPEASNQSGEASSELYPSLRQLPRLAVPYADLYRRVRIQETVFELLSQQYEMARIEEAKDTPVVAVIDQPLVAERKSFPPRTLMTLLLTMLAVGATCFYIVLRSMWEHVGAGDPRKVLAQEISETVRRHLEHRFRRRVGVE